MCFDFMHLGDSLTHYRLKGEDFGINARNGLLPILTCKPVLMQTDTWDFSNFLALSIIKGRVKCVDLTGCPPQEICLKGCLTLQRQEYSEAREHDKA